MKEYLSGAIWRFFSTFWGILYLIVVGINFFSGSQYTYVLGSLGTVYIATLGVFVGGKEFDRWHERHPGKRRGEIFVVLFTVLIAGMFVFSLIYGEPYSVPSDVSAAYIAVVSVFVISHKSKELYSEKKINENKDKTN